MRRNKKVNVPAKNILLIMTIICVLIIGGSVLYSYSNNIVTTIVGYVFIPMQKGINTVGSVITDVRNLAVSNENLKQENDQLREQLNVAKEELVHVQLDEERLAQLEALYVMDQDYTTYPKLAATVIAKDSSNWFSVFTIDCGSNDGVEVGMNVLADGGLAGIVTDVGPNYAKVKSIIDDTSNVSCKNMATSDLCIVSGNLKTMNDMTQIEFSNLSDPDNLAAAGDEIVTSNISDMYLEGIPVGYVTDLSLDSNNLTKSGHIATIVDFAHMNKVLVILELKEQPED